MITQAMIFRPKFFRLVLPLVAAALLGGCLTGDYAYRQDGRGDYYYGQPTTEYRYPGYGGYGGYGGYSPYGYGGYGGYNRYRHGYPYGFGGYYRTPYRPYHPHHPRPPIVVNPPNDDRPPQHHPDDDRRPPWRDLDNVRRRHAGDDDLRQRQVMPARATVQQPRPAVQQPRPVARPMAQPRRQSSSQMGEMIRRAGKVPNSRQTDER